MIGRIRGILLYKKANQILLDVNGLAYEVEVPMSTLFHLPETGKESTLYTHLVVREDAQLLYGFFEEQERTLFRLLIRLNGVGPKMALGILSGLGSRELADCVHRNDVNTLVRIPGVGRKTAERLIVELRDKLDDWYQADTARKGGTDGTSAGKNDQNDKGAYREAEAALIALGYKPQEAAKAINGASQQMEERGEALETSKLLRFALRAMTSRTDPDMARK